MKEANQSWQDIVLSCLTSSRLKLTGNFRLIVCSRCFINLSQKHRELINSLRRATSLKPSYAAIHYCKGHSERQLYTEEEYVVSLQKTCLQYISLYRASQLSESHVWHTSLYISHITVKNQDLKEQHGEVELYLAQIPLLQVHCGDASDLKHLEDLLNLWPSGMMNVEALKAAAQRAIDNPKASRKSRKSMDSSDLSTSLEARNSDAVRRLEVLPRLFLTKLLLYLRLQVMSTSSRLIPSTVESSCLSLGICFDTSQKTAALHRTDSNQRSSYAEMFYSKVVEEKQLRCAFTIPCIKLVQLLFIRLDLKHSPRSLGELEAYWQSVPDETLRSQQLRDNILSCEYCKRIKC